MSKVEDKKEEVEKKVLPYVPSLSPLSPLSPLLFIRAP
jgi:hypothetical protein